MPGARGGAGATGWFHKAFGFEEQDYQQTRTQFVFDEKIGELFCKANKRTFHVGPFEMISCAELEERLLAYSSQSKPGSSSGVALGGLTFQNKNGDVRTLHRDPGNAGAVFQAASQFNCLEMIDYGVTPLHGITIYAKDGTQGPACAMSCPGATLFRNYFVGGAGQGRKQLDGLSDVAADVEVDNEKNKYWKMVNGYCLPVIPGSVANFSQSLVHNPALLARVISKVKVGVHWETDVDGGRHQVCQVFCSALPVAYAKNTMQKAWEPFARAVLVAAFKATLLVGAVLAKKRGARVPIYLTALGGGAFGNRSEWICTAMKDAMCEASILAAPIDVVLVHFGTSIIRQPYDGLEKEVRRQARLKENRGAAASDVATDVREAEGPGGCSSSSKGGRGQGEARQDDREERSQRRSEVGGGQDGASGSLREALGGGSPEPVAKDRQFSEEAGVSKEIASLKGKSRLQSIGKGIVPNRLDDEPHHTHVEPPSKNSKQPIVEDHALLATSSRDAPSQIETRRWHPHAGSSSRHEESILTSNGRAILQEQHGS